MRWWLIKTAVLLGCLLPALLLAYGAVNATLGANPIETLLHDTGLWALRGLLLTLAITPLRKLTRLHALIRLRRTLGLSAFFYVCLHFTIYLLLDREMDWLEIQADLTKRPYIMVGFSAFVLLAALAATSMDSAIKFLGGARWQRLHSLVYPAAALAVLHFAWLVKADVREPLLYAGLLLALLLPRLWWHRQTRRRAAASRAAVSGLGRKFPVAVRIEHSR